jgi:magnesium transporter
VSAVEHLARAFLEAHPPQSARRLEQMRAPEAAAVLRETPPRTSARVLSEMTVPFAAECLGQLPAVEAAAILAEMPSAPAAFIARALESELREPLLASLFPEVREPLARVLRYPAGTAGAVMDPSIFRLPDDVLVAEGRARLGRVERGLLYYIYVVDREHRLVGVLDIAELIFARPRERLSAVMHRKVDRLSAWVPVALVREHPGWREYHAIPVVDDDDRLLGAIRYQTLRRLEREAADTGPDTVQVTAGALAELFRLGAQGLVGIGAVAAAARDAGRSAAASQVPHVDD